MAHPRPSMWPRPKACSDPDSGSFRTDIAAAAVSALQSAGEDPFGEDGERRDVELNENGS